MPDEILSGGTQRPSLLGGRDVPVRPPRLRRPGRGWQVAGAVTFAVAVIAGAAALKEPTPAPPPPEVRRAAIVIPYYPPPPRVAIPTPRPVPHTTLVGGALPATGRAPDELSAFAAMGAVLDHYCAHRGAQSLRPLEGYRHVIAVANPPWEPQIDIELWWTGTSYRWQAQSGPLAACG